MLAFGHPVRARAGAGRRHLSSASGRLQGVRTAAHGSAAPSRRTLEAAGLASVARKAAGAFGLDVAAVVTGDAGPASLGPGLGELLVEGRRFRRVWHAGKGTVQAQPTAGPAADIYAIASDLASTALQTGLPVGSHGLCMVTLLRGHCCARGTSHPWPVLFGSRQTATSAVRPLLRKATSTCPSNAPKLKSYVLTYEGSRSYI